MRSAHRPETGPDLLLVGGGLANGLAALRLAELRPDLDVRIVEAGGSLGGDHTWSFFESDLTQAQRDWIAPLIVHRWPGYTVRFPDFERRLSTPYASVTSERFNAVVGHALGERVTLHADVAEAAPDGVILADGRRLPARAVLDGRGPVAMPHLSLGFQKFVGLEVRLTQPHGLVDPVIMDATVDQAGGYRFLYVLPFDDRTVLIEDTRYTDGADLERDVLRTGVLAYAHQRGWTVERIVREEEGVLPVALDGDLTAHWAQMGTAGLSGLRAGLFHPTTGYSLPDAVRLADHLAQHFVADGRVLAAETQRYALASWGARGFYRLLDRMLFRAARPDQRYKILQRFYTLPQPLIERFYAARSTFADKARILSGRPPVPIGAALACLTEKGHA